MRTATKLQNIFGIIQIFRKVFFKKICVYAHKKTGDCQCMGMEWGTSRVGGYMVIYVKSRTLCKVRLFSICMETEMLWWLKRCGAFY